MFNGIKLKARLIRMLASLVLASSTIAALVSGIGIHAIAAGPITMTASVQTSFPNSMTFNVSAQSDVNITSLRLHYIVNMQNNTSVVSEGWAQFTPAASFKTQWVWDMRKSPLPPATKLEYWWTARDAAGKTAQTDRATVSFDDNRYKWQSITKAPVTLYWYNGDQAFANSLMDAAQQGLQRIQSDTGAIPQGSVRIFIYASSQDLQGAQLFAQPWEGGASFSGYSVIAIGVSPSQLSFGTRAVPHELTHWLTGQITFNNYGAGLPTWLEEGLATYGEGLVAPEYSSALNNAIRNNKLLSVRTLSSPFSSDSSLAYISYGESNSIVTYMIKTYGKDKMRQLLEVFHQGSLYDDALKQVYGFDQDGLDKLWRQSIGASTSYLPQDEPALAGILR